MTKLADAPPIPRLPDFATFVGAMKRYLTLAKRNQVDALLGDLYKAAQQKLILEDARSNAPDRVSELRRKKARMRKASKLIAKSLNLLRKALLDYPNQMTEVGGSIDSLEDDRQSLRNTAQYLQNFLKGADQWQLIYSGLIHPHLRNQAEKNEAKQKLRTGIIAGTILQIDYPARRHSPDIDHWFIGAAAKCLDRYETGTKQKITTYPQIIRAIFEIGFQDMTRSEESIRTELRRQKKEGKPKTPVIVSQKVMATAETMEQESRARALKQKAPDKS